VRLLGLGLLRVRFGYPKDQDLSELYYSALSKNQWVI
jgi:hypothetical protein